MAATTAEENADVNTQAFIGRRRLGGSAGRAAGAELNDAAQPHCGGSLVNPLGAGSTALARRFRVPREVVRLQSATFRGTTQRALCEVRLIMRLLQLC